MSDGRYDDGAQDEGRMSDGCCADCEGCPDCILENRCAECGEPTEELRQHAFGGDDVCRDCMVSLNHERFVETMVAS